MLPEQRYDIAALSALADVETRILKHGEAFGIFDLRGDIYSVKNDELGIYHRGTRYVSRFELRLAGPADLLLLSSYLRYDNGLLKVDLTNPDFNSARKGTIYLGREKILHQDFCYERIVARNYGDEEVRLPLRLLFGSDFRDIFEVRGMRRERRGRLESQLLSDREVDLRYLGLDGVRRNMRISFAFDLESLDAGEARFTAVIPKGGELKLEVSLSFAEEGVPLNFGACSTGIRNVIEAHRHGKRHFCDVTSPSSDLNRWVERSRDDLVMLMTKTSGGDLYPYAGVPWYSTPFGRDGIWTALLCLWANPGMGAGVLRFLARHQARTVDPEADAEPGKIFHEMRGGEMAKLREIPFGLYYGSVDATPLFLVLAGEYHRRTGDLALIGEIWDSLLLANEWIDRYGDADGDGFVEYGTRSAKGLKHQGWKDSSDAIFHADGRPAEGPIALCEVQAYVFGARRALAGLARTRGEDALAGRLELQAEKLRINFAERFWRPELGTLALALDGNKEPCDAVSSNAGHALYFGILPPELAARVAQSLLADDMFTGWGVRTLSDRSVRFNPMSYHNGSVWPHDNAIIALGLARSGHRRAVEQVFEGMFRASAEMEHTRMPELFCGFGRKEGEPPTQYPVACSLQAWASASLYGFLQALLGIDISAAEKRITFLSPGLPPSLPVLHLQNLRVGEACTSLVFERAHGAVAARVEKKTGDLSIRIER